MSLNHTFKQYAPLLQDLHARSKEFDVLTSVSYIGIGLLALFLSRYLTLKDGNGAIRKLGGFPIFTAWTFFTKRFDFIWANFGNDPHFKFKVLHHNVVALRGEEARKAYFDNKSLDFIEGYKILMGGVPRLGDINIEDTQRDNVSSFNKHLVKLLNRNRLSDVLPSLFSDIDKRMKTWGKQGQMDPFKSIYDLVFQMTVRMASCAELSDNFKAIEEIQALYWTLEKSATPTVLLLPWFPGPAKKRKEQATKDLFIKLHDYVELRRNAAVPSSDAIDVLLEEGLSTPDIVGFVLSVIFAGVINTGINSCWALVYLASHTDWKDKVKAEVDSLIQKHTTNSSNEPLHKRLAAIHISAWEDEMPVLELVIRETLRLSVNGVTLRRNLLEDMMLSGGVVKRGDFVAFSLADAHLNPEIYLRPHEFDPARFAPGREEDKKGTFSYLGWGAGRHPCSGMKVAKLEIKIILAFMLAGFDFGIVDKSGKPVTELPKPDRNDIHQSRPLGDPCYLQFKRTVE
ncbi:cytochrome P450 [Phlegmacium glaucopus]|nr:cytochrome P450 [Phlegmacium glaucopus]